MTYKLLIGQQLYSSWSLRGWLPFIVHDIPVEVQRAKMYDPSFLTSVKAFGGDKTVPIVHTPEGGVLSDSIAIAWHLAEAFPDRGLLPDDPAQRALAQSMIAEMHSGFTALRGACAMNLATGWADFAPSGEVLADLARLETIWARALEMSGGPFLFGSYGLVDAFFAPVTIRIAGYGLPISDAAQTYVTAQLAHPALQRWRAEGLAHDAELPVYDMDLPRRPFPMPTAT